MKKIIVMLVLFYSMTRIRAQPVFNPAGSPYLEAVSCNPEFTDAFSCAVDPAALPNLKGFASGFYAEKKYLVEGLNLAMVSLAYGKKNGGGGIFIRYFGNQSYNELHASLNYGKNLGSINLGASFNYNAWSIVGFSKLSVVSIGFHSIWKLSDKFYTSLQLINPPFSRLGSLAFKQEAEYYLGFSYEVSPMVCLSMEFQKIENIPLEVNSAVQYCFGQKFYAKAGLYTAGLQPFFGLGWLLKDFHVQFSISYHPALGATPGILFTYEKTGDVSLQ